jgi:GMP synthase (glutamine-hydrolysing)
MAKKPVLMLTHVTARDGGEIAVIAAELGHAVEVRRLNKGEPLPENVTDYAGIASFGSPASANDEHVDFIRAELDWIPRVTAAEVPFLGICFGAQMFARTLGAKVAPHPEGQYEFGYYPITPLGGGGDLKMAGPLQISLRHGEGFDLPAGAEHLAAGETFPIQAFRYGAAGFAFQFHPEVNDEVLSHWLDRDPPPEDLTKPGAQDAETQRRNHARYRPAMHAWLRGFIAHWLSLGRQD